MPYANMASIWRFDRDLLEHSDGRKYKSTLDQADHNVNSLLRRRRINPLEVVLEPVPARATVTLHLTNTSTATEDDTGEITVQEGTKFSMAGTHAPAFLTTETVTLEAGETVEVEAEAEFVGDVYNVMAGDIDTSPVTNITVANNEDATGGISHPLQMLAAYEAMLLILYDVFRLKDDAWDYKRKLVTDLRDQEFEALLAAGILIESEGGTRTTTNGKFRLERS